MSVAGSGAPAWWRPALLSPASAVLLVAGATLVCLLPELPGRAVIAGGLALALLLVWRWPLTRLLALPLLGAAWMLLHADAGLRARLPAALEGEDIVLGLRITGLPERGDRQQRFEARVEQAPEEASALVGAKLRLGWFGQATPNLLPGERWLATVRLKRPRGTLNPGGFDYERHALEQGIAATGYLRDAPPPQKLSDGAGVDGWRLQLAAAIDAGVESPSRRFLRGLAVGDRRALDGDDWERLRATGLSHLLAISGLHIGLLAGFGALLARALYWLWPGLGLKLPRPQGMALLAMPFAIGYAALAGFGLPTQRSLLMIGCVLLAVLLRRSVLPAQGLALAAIAIVLVDPLALLGAGFWLSFLGVAWLLLCLPSAAQGSPGMAASLLRAQGVLSLGLLPLTVWFFGQASLAGAFANLVAVPLVTLLIVPLTLAGTALLAWPLVASSLLGAAAWLMDWLWRLAGWLEALPGAQLFLPEPAPWALLLALSGIGWLLLPRGLPGKPLAVLLLLPLLLPVQPRLQAGELELTLVDVGQGLSVLLRTREHALLYDAGPAFAGGLDLGEAAVVPALRAQGLRRLDMIVLSHGDNDHAGGAGAVRRAFAVPPLFSGEPQRVGAGAACADQPPWQWDGVSFAFLHPPPHFPELGNEASCVLSVRAAGGHVLLPGDIGHVIEGRLLRDRGEELAADILLLPHHGSQNSSSPAFVDATRPRLALVASGHRNRFGHPRPEVVQRYLAAGARLEGTVEGGALRIRLDPEGAIEVQRRRDSHLRFWHERGVGTVR